MLKTMYVFLVLQNFEIFPRSVGKPSRSFRDVISQILNIMFAVLKCEKAHRIERTLVSKHRKKISFYIVLSSQKRKLEMLEREVRNEIRSCHACKVSVKIY